MPGLMSYSHQTTTAQPAAAGSSRFDRPQRREPTATAGCWWRCHQYCHYSINTTMHTIITASGYSANRTQRQLTVNFKVAKTVWWYCEWVSSSTGSQRMYVIPQTPQFTVSWSFWPKSCRSFTKQTQQPIVLACSHISDNNGMISW